MAGIDPAPLRLWELVAIAEARQRASWWRTAHVMCLLANINRGKGRRPFEPGEFFPFDRDKRRKTIPLTRDTIESLKVFL